MSNIYVELRLAYEGLADGKNNALEIPASKVLEILEEIDSLRGAVCDAESKLEAQRMLT